jgi:hypothetical protein
MALSRRPGLDVNRSSQTGRSLRGGRFVPAFAVRIRDWLDWESEIGLIGPEGNGGGFSRSASPRGSRPSCKYFPRLPSLEFLP